MLPEKKYLNVNWSDGMNISKDHFLQLENAFGDHLRDTVALTLTPYNYGLLLPSATSAGSLALTLTSNQVQLTTCRAITSGGVRIEIPTYTSQRLQLTLTDADYTHPALAVVLSINPFDRMAVGQPNPNENSARPPYAVPNCKLLLKPLPNVLEPEFSMNELVIGRITINQGEARLDPTYIPPCNRVASHKRLNDELTHCVSLIEQVAQNALRVQHIIHNSEAGHDPHLAQGIQLLANGIISPALDLVDQYRLTLPYQAPVFSFLAFVRIARAIHIVLQGLPKTQSGDQAILNYFGVAGFVEVSTFKSVVQQIVGLTYPSPRDGMDSRNGPSILYPPQ